MYVGSDTVTNLSPRIWFTPLSSHSTNASFICHLSNEQWASYMSQFHVESHPTSKIYLKKYISKTEPLFKEKLQLSEHVSDL